MTRQPLVSIIVTTWNARDVLKACLKSLSKISYSNFELILVDNGSTDGTKEDFYGYRKMFRRLKTVSNDSNLGFAKANNIGYKRAKGSFILLLNNDTQVTPLFLEKMVKRMIKQPDLGAIQPMILIKDDKKLLDNCGSYITNIGFLIHRGFLEKISSKYTKEQIVFSVKGACLLTRKKIIKKVGLFDEDFVSYFEESDFCWRIWMAGSLVAYFPGAKIYHKLGFTSKMLSPINVSYHSIKNNILTLYKNLETISLVRILGVHLVILLGLMVYYVAKLQFKKAGMIGKALLWNIWNLPASTIKRRRIQRKRKVDDITIFRQVRTKVNLAKLYSHFLKVENNY